MRTLAITCFVQVDLVTISLGEGRWPIPAVVHPMDRESESQWKETSTEADAGQGARKKGPGKGGYLPRPRDWLREAPTGERGLKGGRRKEGPSK